MNKDQQNQQGQAPENAQGGSQPQQTQQTQQSQQPGQSQQDAGQTDLDGLADKKPEELTPEELRLMADTMPGEGPGD
jgi:hypothetical protein